MANRAMRRKNKINNDKETEMTLEKSDLSSATKVTVAVALILIFFYIITVLGTGGFRFNKDTGDNENAPVVIQYDEILATEIFSMKNSEYYVLLYDFDDSAAVLYNLILSNFEGANTSAKVYTVDLAKGINKHYMAKTSNQNAGNIDELKITGPTVIKIKDGKNVAYGEGQDAIKNILK